MSKKTETDITRVTYRWDDHPGSTPGWYCQSYEGDEFRDDSQKVWFPVSVDTYGEDERAELVAELKEAFPSAEVVEG